MAARDFSFQVCAAAINLLRADSTLAGWAGARIYGMTAPPPPLTWPFIKWGSPIITPFEAQSFSGSSNRITIDVFARDDGAGLPWLMAAQVVAVLDAAQLIFGPSSGTIDCRWLQTQTLRDSADPAEYHLPVEFSIISGQAG